MLAPIVDLFAPICAILNTAQIVALRLVDKYTCSIIDIITVRIDSTKRYITVPAIKINNIIKYHYCGQSTNIDHTGIFGFIADGVTFRMYVKQGQVQYAAGCENCKLNNFYIYDSMTPIDLYDFVDEIYCFQETDSIIKGNMDIRFKFIKSFSLYGGAPRDLMNSNKLFELLKNISP